MVQVVGFRVEGLGVKVQCLVFRVHNSGFRVEGFVSCVLGSRLMVYSLCCRVHGFGFRGSGFRVRYRVRGVWVRIFDSGIWVQGSVFSVLCSWFRVRGLGFMV